MYIIRAPGRRGSARPRSPGEATAPSSARTTPPAPRPGGCAARYILYVIYYMLYAILYYRLYTICYILHVIYSILYHLYSILYALCSILYTLYSRTTPPAPRPGGCAARCRDPSDLKVEISQEISQRFEVTASPATVFGPPLTL